MNKNLKIEEIESILQELYGKENKEVKDSQLDQIDLIEKYFNARNFGKEADETIASYKTDTSIMSN